MFTHYLVRVVSDSTFKVPESWTRYIFANYLVEVEVI